MGILSNLFRLTPATFRANYCPASWQQFANDLIGGTQLTALIDLGSVTFNYGATTPIPEMRIFPWIRTTDGRLYTFLDGVWTTPYQYDPGPNGLRLDWEAPVDGSASGLWTFGGADGSDPSVVTPTATTGSFWTVDTNYAGRVTMGPGAVPVTSNPAVTTTVGQTGGEGQHTLDQTEGGAEAHTHNFGVTNSVGDDAYFRKTAVKSGLNYNGFYITGSGPHDETAQTTSDLETLQNTVAAILPHNNLQPYRVAYKIKRTGRVYVTLPP